MYEVEYKVPADLDRVRERLTAIGADHVDAVRQVDTYYDAPDRDFAETDEAVRVRRQEPLDGGSTTAHLVYKGPKVGDEGKTRKEVDTAVDDPDATDALLGSLGFDAAAVVEKEREHYRIDGYTVTVDDVTDAGTFVEVERVVGEGDVTEARTGAVALLDRLGLDVDDEVRTSYLELALAEDPVDGTA